VPPKRTLRDVRSAGRFDVRPGSDGGAACFGVPEPDGGGSGDLARCLELLRRLTGTGMPRSSSAAENDTDFLTRIARRWVDAIDQDGTEPATPHRPTPKTPTKPLLPTRVTLQWVNRGASG
jgi:hypothetical protein